MSQVIAVPTSVRDDGGPGKPDRTLHHFAFVDALRGYAILTVLMVHSSKQVSTMFGAVRDFVAGGVYGVQLFFVVSAFTLFWSLQNRSQIDRAPLSAFFVRRFFRIAPLFWAGVLFYSLWPEAWRSVYAPHGVGWPHIVSTILLVHGWYPTTINTIVPGGWSIGAEAMFYLCIPVLFKRIRSLSGAMWAALLSTLALRFGAPLAIHLLRHHFPASWSNLIGEFVFWSFPSQLPVFCMGFVLYFVLLGQTTTPARFEGISKKQRAFFLLLAGLLVICGIPLQVTFGIAFVLIAWALAIHPIRLLVNRAIRYVGLVSYSMYIWHFWILDRVLPHLLPSLHFLRSDKQNGTLQFAMIYASVIVLSLIVATLSYYIIELPSQRMGKNLIARMGWGSDHAGKSLASRSA